MKTTRQTNSCLRTVVCLLAVVVATALHADTRQVSRLLQDFDKASRAEATATANRLFTLLRQEGFTDEAVNFTDKTPRDTVRAQTWYWGAEYLYAKGENKLALSYATRALPLAEDGHDDGLKASLSALLSILHMRDGNYAEAIAEATKVLKMDRASGDKSYISSDLNTIAGIYLASKQPRQALPYAREAIKLSTEARDTARMAIQMGMASEICHNLGDDREALRLARQAYALETARGDEGKAAVRLCQAGTALIALGRDDEARQALTTALPQLKRAGNQQSYAIACNQLGELALKRRDNRAAADYYGLALDYFTSQGDLYNEATAQRGLYLAQRESDKAAAMRHLERYAALKDTLYNRDAGRTLSEYDARYHNEELRHANAEQRSRQRVVIATALAAIVTLAAIVVILLLLRRIHSRRHRHEREQMEMKDRFFTFRESVERGSLKRASSFC